MNVELKFEWDEDKRKTNLAKHGLDFAEVQYFDFGNAMEAEQLESGELRIFAIRLDSHSKCRTCYKSRCYGKTLHTD